MALNFFSLKKFLPLNLCLLLLLIQNPLFAEQESLAGEDAPDNEQQLTNEATGDSEQDQEATNLSKILDPKKRQYMHGQLAYWFKNYASAIKLWQPLAEEGDPKAQASLGWLYHKGLGVTQDYQTAFEWYQKSAMQDYTLGQHNLGTMYENGWGVQQDYKEAFKWYKFGADKAYGNSVFNLGMLYLDGLGTERDKEKAIHLLKSAHQLNVQEASAILRDLGVEVVEQKAISHNPPPIPDPK